MKWAFLKNPWLCALALLVTSFVLVIVLGFVVSSIFGLPYDTGTVPAGIVAPIIFGFLYVKKTKEVMARRMRVEVSAIFLLYQFVLGFMVFALLGNLPISGWYEWGLLVLVFAIVFAITYAGLGRGGNASPPPVNPLPAKKSAKVKKN